MTYDWKEYELCQPLQVVSPCLPQIPLEPPPWIPFNSLITYAHSYLEDFAYVIISTKNVFFFFPS